MFAPEVLETGNLQFGGVAMQVTPDLPEVFGG
jgi:hypothetical protein